MVVTYTYIGLNFVIIFLQTKQLSSGFAIEIINKMLFQTPTRNSSGERKKSNSNGKKKMTNISIKKPKYIARNIPS